MEDNALDLRIGRYIGSLERLLTVIGVVAGAPEVLVALYGTKAAIRFGQARDNPAFADYYIMGTFLSVLLGVLFGIAVRLTLFIT